VFPLPFGVDLSLFLSLDEEGVSALLGADFPLAFTMGCLALVTATDIALSLVSPLFFFEEDDGDPGALGVDAPLSDAGALSGLIDGADDESSVAVALPPLFQEELSRFFFFLLGFSSFPTPLAWLAEEVSVEDDPFGFRR
jgi:hypothetical protein